MINLCLIIKKSKRLNELVGNLNLVISPIGNSALKTIYDTDTLLCVLNKNINLDLVRLIDNSKVKGKLTIKFHANGIMYVNIEWFEKWLKDDYPTIKQIMIDSANLNDSFNSDVITSDHENHQNNESIVEGNKSVLCSFLPVESLSPASNIITSETSIEFTPLSPPESNNSTMQCQSTSGK